jgi:hypothetical protein
MPVYKLVPIVLIGAILLTCGVFFFVPGLRPGFVQKWFDQAKGFTPATSPEDALGKLKKAIEKRDYDAAKLYLTGDYLEQFDKGREEALKLANEIDALRVVMKDNGVKSNKVDMVLYWMDPFPAFKYEVKNPSKDSTKSVTAVINWNDDAGRFNDASGYSVNFDVGLKHSLLPVGYLVNGPLTVTVKEVEEGVWKVEVPVQIGDRHMRYCVQSLEKNASNIANAMGNIKNDVKRDKAVKADFEHSFKSNIEKSK